MTERGKKKESRKLNPGLTAWVTNCNDVRYMHIKMTGTKVLGIFSFSERIINGIFMGCSSNNLSHEINRELNFMDHENTMKR